MANTKLKRFGRIVAIGTLAALLIASGGIGFGLGRDDVARARAFADAVRNWQKNPDFRNVQREYVTLGVDAMRARMCGASGETIVMAFRSLPGLPEYLRVSPTSAAHYRAFGSGDLAAYLHLTGEQGVGDAIVMIEELGRREVVTDAEAVAFLQGFKLPWPVATDAGAIASVRSLLRDVDGSQTFAIRDDVARRLRELVGQDVFNMTRQEQAIEFLSFDREVKARDPELWRAKQVSDFLAGIWAQSYGQVYLSGIEWMLRLRLVARVIFIAAVLAAAAWIARRIKLSRSGPAS